MSPTPRDSGPRTLAAHLRDQLVPTALWLGVMATIVVIWWLTYGGFQVGTYQDDAKYVILARALAAGEPYGQLDIGPAPPIITDYPFVFPGLLVPFVSWWPDALERMTLLSLIATLVNVTLIYWGWPVLTHSTSRWWALAVSALYGLTPTTLGHVGMVMSEPVFTTWVMIGLLLAERSARRRAPSLTLFVALGFVCALAVFTRIVGATLIPAVLLRSLAAAEWDWRRVAACAAGVLLLVLPVLGLSPVRFYDLLPDHYLSLAVQPSSGLYEDTEDSLTTRIARGAALYAKSGLREALVPVGGGERERAFWTSLGLGGLAIAGNVLIVGCVILGVVAAPRPGRVRPAVLWFELLTLAIILAWPFRTARFLYPLLPFLYFQLLQGLRLLIFRPLALVGAVRASPIAGGIVAAVAVSLITVMPYRFVRDAMPSTYFAPDFRAATAWLREQSPADAVVLSEEWAAVAVYVERALVPAVDSDAISDLVDAVRTYHIDYVLVTPERAWLSGGKRKYTAYAEQTYLPFVRAMVERGALTAVFEGPAPDRVSVYRVDTTRLPFPGEIL